MILPSKHLRQERSLLGIGAEILRLASEEKSVSTIWDEFRRREQQQGNAETTFDWFVLAMDFLYAAGAVEIANGKLRRVPR